MIVNVEDMTNPLTHLFNATTELTSALDGITSLTGSDVDSATREDCLERLDELADLVIHAQRIVLDTASLQISAGSR